MEDFALTPAEQALFRALVARRVRFMIIGLGAALVEGAAVATQDIDLWFEHAMDPEVSTDPALSARSIIESFAKRWSLEVAFPETKGKLGFEDPQNRTERAVERTAPFAFIAYTLVIVWYVIHGQRSAAAKLPTMPWYTQKSGTTFSDMLATLRRASWRQRLLDPAATTADLRKSLRPLVDYIAGAA